MPSLIGKLQETYLAVSVSLFFFGYGGSPSLETNPSLKGPGYVYKKGSKWSDKGQPKLGSPDKHLREPFGEPGIVLLFLHGNLHSSTTFEGLLIQSHGQMHFSMFCGEFIQVCRHCLK